MKIFNRAIAVVAVFAVAACQQSADTPADDMSGSDVPAAAETAADTSALDAVLAAQPDEVQARYTYRNPKETIEFFGIEPGMTVVEGLPGRGWYTKLLLPYLGSDGCLIGADYSLEMYPMFSFVNDEFMENQKQWATTFVANAAEWSGDAAPSVEAFHFGSMPDDLAGKADVVFFPRVLHNLARFESDGGFLTRALADAYTILKPGGTFGVVQHQARDGMSDTFADGSRGYLKKAFVIAAIEQAGFEFVAESDINANPADQPGEDDIVWRLPPTLATSREDPELRAELEAIGESNRMTLKFRKPE
ncbi:MAG: methyltransferase [Pseudomonadota bacterium]